MGECHFILCQHFNDYSTIFASSRCSFIVHASVAHTLYVSLYSLLPSASTRLIKFYCAKITQWINTLEHDFKTFNFITEQEQDSSSLFLSRSLALPFALASIFGTSYLNRQRTSPEWSRVEISRREKANAYIVLAHIIEAKH